MSEEIIKLSVEQVMDLWQEDDGEIHTQKQSGMVFIGFDRSKDSLLKILNEVDEI